MIIQRASNWIIGTAVLAVAAYFASVATAETIADAFEPDLDSWDAFS
jgi:hypothetical protein